LTDETAIADNIESLDTKEEDEVSLDGFGSTNITSTSLNEEQEEDDNKYYRDQAIEEANKKYGLMLDKSEKMEMARENVLPVVMGKETATRNQSLKKQVKLYQSHKFTS
jgi:hypothetical protein